MIASNAFIADGARVQGDIIAEELIVGGCVNGNIHALRVKLQATAVVEGDISHRSLSIDEHASGGCSIAAGWVTADRCNRCSRQSSLTDLLFPNMPFFRR